MLIPKRLGHTIHFPDPKRAESHGLLAYGGDLSTERLVEAYRRGIFPWYSTGEPIMWWSPDPRLVIFPEELHISRSLAKFLRKDPFRVTIDAAFRTVISSCSAAIRPREAGTWITPEMIEAYCSLHESGVAHSVECWKDGEVVGGMYGVAIGRCFFGESMFSQVNNASKVALVTLVQRMRNFGYAFLDCQLPNPHLTQFGPQEIPRIRFLHLLARHVIEPEPRGMWSQCETNIPSA